MPRANPAKYGLHAAGENSDGSFSVPEAEAYAWPEGEISLEPLPETAHGNKAVSKKGGAEDAPIELAREESPAMKAVRAEVEDIVDQIISSKESDKRWGINKQIADLVRVRRKEIVEQVMKVKAAEAAKGQDILYNIDDLPRIVEKAAGIERAN